MSTSTLGLFLRHLALSEEVSRLGTTSDHHLLAAYESGHGQAAFTELMRRHGPMVLRTCRRVLGRGPDAEDAFQATFVMLARKAGQLGRGAAGRQSLCGWLHRVAYRTAADVLTGKIRRKAHERQASVMTHPDPDPSTEATWNEIRPILDAELDTLPDEARRLLIACYLEGKSYSEVAAELGLPRSSVARHLEKARGLLARRLARRGITVSAVLLAILLEDSVKGAGMPAVLLVHTVEAARTFTEQAVGMLSENVARLVKGGLAKMSKGWTHWSMALAGWVGLLGAGLIACQTLRAWPDSPPESEPPATRAERPAQQRDKQTRTDLYGDPLPAGALARMGTTRLRYGGNCVVFAPDGKTIATYGWDDTVRLWDVASGKLVRSLKHPENLGRAAIAFAQKGKTLVCWGESGIWRWDVKTGKQFREIKLKVSDQPVMGGIGTLTNNLRDVSSDGKIVAWGQDGIAQLWDAETGNSLGVLKAPGKYFHHFLSPDGKTLAGISGGDKGKWIVSLWEVSSRKFPPAAPIHKLEIPQLSENSASWAITFSPDSKTLAIGGADKSAPGSPIKVWLWDVATGKLIRTLEKNQEWGFAGIHKLALSPDGKIVALYSWGGGQGGGERVMRLCDTTTGEDLRKLKYYHTGDDNGLLTFSPDGKVLAAGRESSAVRLWDVTTGKEFHRPVHQGSINSISFSSDGQTLATVGGLDEEEGTIRLWDAASGKLLREVDPPGSLIKGLGWGVRGLQSVIFAPDGKTLVAGEAGLGCILDATTGNLLRELQPRRATWPIQLLMAVSPDGKLVAGADHDTATGSGSLRLWDAATGKRLNDVDFGRNWIRSVAFSPDGKTLAVGTAGRHPPYLLDAVTGKEKKAVIELPNVDWDAVTSLAFSPDGRTLAAAAVVNNARDRVICLVEVVSGSVWWHTFPSKGDTSSEAGGVVAFSPNGQLLAYVGERSVDKTVRLWKVNAGLVSQCHEFQVDSNGIQALAFSPDGRRLASASGGTSTVLVWDVAKVAGGQAGLGKRQPRAVPLTQGELTACWQSLASLDAAQAYQTMRTLAAAPEQAVPFLAERLFLKKPDPQQVARLLADLDSEDFRVRSKARKELKKLGIEQGEAVEPALRQALKDNPASEVRQSIQQLLNEIHPDGGVSQGLLRGSRVVQVLEWIGNSAAQELLKKLAVDPPWEDVGQEAKTALKAPPRIAQPLIHVSGSRPPSRVDGSSCPRRRDLVQLVKGELAQMIKTSTHFSIWLAGCVSLLGAGLIACQTLKAWPDSPPENEPPTVADRPAQEGDKQARTDLYGDPLPPGALARLGTLRLRHNSQLGSRVFTPDGKGLLTVGGGHKFPRVCDVATGKLIRDFADILKPLCDTLRGEIGGVKFSPDGRILAVRVISLQEGKKEKDAFGREVRKQEVRLCLLEAATGKRLREFKGDGVQVPLAFSPEGQTIVVKFTGKPNIGKLVGRIELLDVATGRSLRQMEARGHIAAFSPDGKILAMGYYNGHDGEVSLWDARAGELLRKLDFKANVHHIAFSPDGRTFAIGCHPRKGIVEGIYLWDVATVKEVRQLGDPGKTIVSPVFSPDGKIVAGRGEEGIYLWDAATGKELRFYPVQYGKYWNSAPIAFSPDGKMLAAQDGPIVRFRDVASGKTLSFRLPTGHESAVNAVAFMPDGHTLISTGRDRTIRWWDTRTGQQGLCQQRLKVRFTNNRCVPTDILSPNGTVLAITDSDIPHDMDGPWRKWANFTLEEVSIIKNNVHTSIRLWDAVSGKELRCLDERKGRTEGRLAFSPDGKVLAQSFCWNEISESPTVCLWDLASGKRYKHILAGNCLVFSPDSSIIATLKTAEKESTALCFWEVATGKKIDSVSTNEYMRQMTLSPDGNTLATVSEGGKITLYPMLWGKQSAVHLGKPPLLAARPSSGNSNGAVAFSNCVLAFSPDGRMLASAEWGGQHCDLTVHVWEVVSGKERARFAGHIDEVTALAFSADGRRLVSGSADTTMLIWDVTGRVQDGSIRSTKFTEKELEGLWKGLASSDATRAGQAVWALVAAGPQTVSLLGERLRPTAAKASSEVVPRLIADLDSEDFKTREKARRELEKLGEVCESVLREALSKQPPPEMRRSLQELLAQLEERRKELSGEALRGVRAVEVLEQIGTPEARGVLQGWSRSGGGVLQREAQAALGRLDRKQPPG